MEPMVAIAGKLLLQVPPPPSVSVAAPPGQIAVVPVIIPGKGLTVTVADCAQPVPEIVYTITDVPALTPVTVPALTVAKEGELLDHAPPVVVSPSNVVDPAQTVSAPVIGLGNGLIVTTRVAKHPEPFV